MAKKGASYFVWAKMATEPTDAKPTYSDGFNVGGLNQIDRKITYATAELPADDKVKYKESEFASGEVSVKLSEFLTSYQALLFGHSYVDGQMGAHDTDTAPVAGIGYVQTIQRISGSVKSTVYRAIINPKVQAIQGDMSATTRGSSITLGTEDFTLTVFQPEFADWEITKEFSSFASAQAFVNTYLNISTAYAVNVQVNGETTGESATPEGTTMVTSGQNFVLTITGTPTALYDNGTESKASIADGKYTLTNVTLVHNIAVIF